MTELILHHYPRSTYSEKIRLAFGLKRLRYREVITPIAMPKPDLVPLTGGYRRAPVLQIGADLWCDSKLILRLLERLHPAPTLFPGHTAGLADGLAWWFERTVFMAALGFVANTNPALFPPDFVAERKPFGFIIGKEDNAPHYDHQVQLLAAHLGWVASTLADGRPFLLGSAVGAADLAFYPTIWFLRGNGGAEAERLLPLAALGPWFDRVSALGHGEPTPIDGSTALDTAHAATPSDDGLPTGRDPTGLEPGTPVTVTADDTGRDPVHGVLVAANAEEVVIRREDTRVGVVQLHFPRAGFDVARA